MEKGALFTRYEIVNGKADKSSIILFYRPSSGGKHGRAGTLYWGSNMDESADRSLPLDSVTAVEPGKTTAPLKSDFAKSAPDDRCFSLVAPKLVLALEAPNKTVADDWGDCLYHLVRASLAMAKNAPSPINSNAANANAPERKQPNGDHKAVDNKSEDSISIPKDRRLSASPNPDLFFTFVSKLGEGSYGSVFKAIDRRDQKPVAIKVLPSNSDVSASLRKEIGVLEQCNNEHIVGYRGTFFKDSHIWIVMEYCAAGSLTDIMDVNERTFREDEIACALKQAIKGLVYLHASNKIHRDIKAANILATANGTCKLADFGVAGELVQTLKKKRTVIGTPHWMAPEVLVSDEDYNEKADIWSLGVTAFELAVGEPPHGGLHPMRVVWKIPNSPPPTLPEPHRWSKHFHDFLAACVQKEFDKRPSAADLLKHPFIANAKDSSVIMDMVRKSVQSIEQFEAQPASARSDGTASSTDSVTSSSSGGGGAGGRNTGIRARRTRRTAQIDSYVTRSAQPPPMVHSPNSSNSASNSNSAGGSGNSGNSPLPGKRLSEARGGKARVSTIVARGSPPPASASSGARSEGVDMPTLVVGRDALNEVNEGSSISDTIVPGAGNGEGGDFDDDERPFSTMRAASSHDSESSDGPVFHFDDDEPSGNKFSTMQPSASAAIAAAAASSALTASAPSSASSSPSKPVSKS